MSKSLSQIGLGFYSFDLTLIELSNLIDDTYSYSIVQDGSSLKRGFVHLVIDSSVNKVFDFTLDFTLS